VENYCIIASSVLLFADTFMTFTEEVQRIWNGRFTGATVVFLITRYAAVAERTTLLVSLFLPTLEDRSLSSCVPVLRLDDTLTDISYLIFGVFMVLRARGIWGEGWLPIAFLMLLTPVRTIITMARLLRSRGFIDYVQTHYTPIAFGLPLYGCGAFYQNSDDLIRAVGVASRLSSVSIDITVLILTWARTLGVKRESQRLGMRTPIATLLLRDGTMYFLVILFIQVFSITSAIVSAIRAKDEKELLTNIRHRFTVIFSCRFMLNLRGIHLADSVSSPESAVEFGMDPSMREVSGLHFASIVGNLGAPLETMEMSSADSGGRAAA
ncbi:hypothetical protein BD414DRAFT_423925, partial [Trametes punicea]